MNVRSKKNRIHFVASGGVVVLIFCLILGIHMANKTVPLRSDSKGVEFVTEGETITCVNIRGQFPYHSIVPDLAEELLTDAEGNVTEIYTIEAEFSLNRQVSMKLDIESSDEVIYTYILKFADRDVTIVDGKVME